MSATPVAGAQAPAVAVTPISATALAALQSRVFTFTAGPTVEGGLSLNTSDSGNYLNGVLIGSNHGVSAQAAHDYLAKYFPGTTLTAEWMASLTMATAQDIAIKGYWDTIWLNYLAPVSPGLCLSIFDHGYNRGPKTSGALFQAAIGIPAYDPVTKRALHDGIIGNDSVQAYRASDMKSLASLLGRTSALAVQKYVGADQDGDVGPVTLTKVDAKGARNILALYAMRDLQKTDYRALADIAENPGWLIRADARLAAGLALEML